MEAYRVKHKRSGDIYYLLSDSADDAIEHLTLMLGDAEGRSAWEATPDTPAHRLTKGVILDGDGKVVKTLEG